MRKGITLTSAIRALRAIASGSCGMPSHIYARTFLEGSVKERTPKKKMVYCKECGKRVEHVDYVYGVCNECY